MNLADKQIIRKSLPKEAETVLGEIDLAGNLVDALHVALQESHPRAMPLYLAAEWCHYDILRSISLLSDAEADLIEPAYTDLEQSLRAGMEQCLNLFGGGENRGN